MTKYLAMKGFFEGEFRSVWSAPTRDSAAESPPSPAEVRRFGAGELDEFLTELERIAGGVDGAADEVKRSETGNAWHHYIAYFEGVPAATSTMRVGDGVGYLAWSYVVEAYRRRGLQGLLIRQRVQDARDHGCDTVFSVTSFNVPSARNLQRQGLKLAYNYVMLVRPQAG